MPAYINEPDYDHSAASRIGVLIANLGTPDAPHPREIRRFLAEFLGDPRVIEAPRWLWLLALHGVILRVRPAKSAHAYRQVWTESGSPLMIHSRALTSEIADRLGPDLETAIALGMTYGSPSIPNALTELRRAGARRLIVLPLYPQYSATTTASVFDRVTSELQRWRWIPELRFITSYHDEPAYVAAISASIAAHRRSTQTEDAHLLFSFHGVPRKYLEAGDPYHCQCHKTARLVATQLGLAEGSWTVAFQSQVGPSEWLRPYTNEWLVRFAQQGGKRVSVVCPGFATDCLETLEEIAIRNRATFLESGGETYEYIPALNADPTHADLLADLIRKHASGWATRPADSSAKERALQLGAAR